jgi:hypothetical protein
MTIKKNSDMKLIMENWRVYRISNIQKIIKEFLSNDTSGYPEPSYDTQPDPYDNAASPIASAAPAGDIRTQAEDILMKAFAEFEDIENWGQKGREIQALYSQSVATLEQKISNMKKTGYLSKSTHSSLDSFANKVKETKGRAASLTTILVLTKMLDLIEDNGNSESAVDSAVKKAISVSSDVLDKALTIKFKPDDGTNAPSDDEEYNKGFIDSSRRRSGYLMKQLKDLGN